MLTRILTAILLIPPVIAVLWFNPLGRGVFVLVGLLSAGMLIEFFRLSSGRGIYDFALAWLAGLLWMLSVGQPLVAEVEPLIGVGLVIGAFLPSLIRGDVRGGASRTAWVLLGGTYIGNCFARHSLLLYEVDRGQWVFVALAAIWTCDTVAYFVGKSTGRYPLSPAISPAKTWEGALAGFLGAVIGGTVVAAVFEPNAWRVALGGSALLGVMGQVGDLAESLLKRCAGVKDSGAFLPGHGGLLDRLDSLTFAMPTLYWYLRFAGVAP